MPTPGVICTRCGWVRVSLLVLVAFGAARIATAVSSTDGVKAAYLYRFASYIEWPEDVMVSGSFVIAVAGADEVARHLDELSPRMTVHGRPTVIRRITRARDLEGVHILYAGGNSFARTRALRAAALEKPILIVTDYEEGIDAGGVINFLESNGNVRFEISLLAADRARLKIDSALLAIAARVERRPQAQQ